MPSLWVPDPTKHSNPSSAHQNEIPSPTHVCHHRHGTRARRGDPLRPLHLSLVRFTGLDYFVVVVGVRGSSRIDDLQADEVCVVVERQ
jgi:hypothetical protein